MVPISYHLILSGILFTIGVTGVLLRRNIIIIFMSIELMLNAVNLSFVALAGISAIWTDRSSCSLSCRLPRQRSRLGWPLFCSFSVAEKRSTQTNST